MPAKDPGGGTPFESMSHEQMLAWLDQANAGEVQAAANRLTAAAKAIREIADELKVRPQWVAWKGQGADAFRTWSADLANSTLRLGDFSEDAAKWLTEASGAIAQAQASIPRDTESASANLAAAKAAHNDPDAAAVADKSSRELAALAAHKDEVRQQAAAQMRKLGQTYAWSATQMNALERPKFPPPPEAVRPPESQSLLTAVDRPAAGTPSSGVVAAADATQGGGSSAHAANTRRSVGLPSPEHDTATGIAPAPGMAIDSMATLPPQTPHTPTEAVSGPPALERRETPSQPSLVPPALGNNRGPSPIQSPGKAVSGSTGPVRAVTGSPRQGAPTTGPIGPGQAAATGRSLLPHSQGVPPGSSSRVPSGPASGIVGGRPVTPPTGRPTGAIPRGVVVGRESAPVRGPLGPTTGNTNPIGRVVGQPGQVAGRRLPSPNGPVTGGRPLPHNGVVGDSPQRPGHAGAGMPTPGGPTTGSTSVARGGITGGATSAARTGGSERAGEPRASQPTSPTNTGRGADSRTERKRPQKPGSSTAKRNVPRVID